MKNTQNGHRHMHLFSFWVTCLILVAFSSMPLDSTPAWADQAMSEDQAIWWFDFRDIFYDVAFLNGQDSVIVGARGRVLVTHRRYKNLWCVHDSGTKELLTCLSFADGRHGWAAGHGGIILHTADGGRTWATQRASSPENQPLFDVQALSPQVCYACGAFDTFLKTHDGGQTWTRVPTGFDRIYNGLAFLDENEGFLVGEFGTVLCTNDAGNSWTQLEIGGWQGSLFGITLLSAKRILVYGIAGKVLRSDNGGQTWVEVSPGVDESLFRGAVSGDEVLIVGSSGTALYSRDGGRHFTTQTDEDLTTFAGVCAHPGGGFLCVGERGKIYRLNRLRND